MNIAARLRIALWVVMPIVAVLPMLTARPAAAATVAWADCGDGFQCASMPVPLDYQHPDGGTISISMLKLPAGDAAHRIGSLVINPGGPGGSGVSFLRTASTTIPAGVRSRFDLIGFDPRGVGESSPVRCFANSDEQSRYMQQMPTYPQQPDEMVKFEAVMGQVTAMCGHRNASLLPHLSTANVARDMDRLRGALGDAKLTYLGFSYGSYLGATYANLFPDRVRAMVLDGIAEPVEYSTGRGPESLLWTAWNRIQSDVATSEVMKEFLARCADAGPGACAFGAGGATATSLRFDQLLQRLHGSPTVWQTALGPTTFDDRMTEALTLQVLYEPLLWRYWAALLNDLDRGSAPTEIDQILVQALQMPTQPGYDNSTEAQWASSCVDTDSPPSAALWPAIARLSELRAPHFGSLWTYNGLACATWPARDTSRYTGPWSIPTSAPVLVVGTTHDPATRYQNAVELSQEMPGSRLLTVDGWGHTALAAGSSCANDAESAYLVGGELPRPGTQCRADQSPFGAVSAAAMADAAHVASAMRGPTMVR